MESDWKTKISTARQIKIMLSLFNQVRKIIQMGRKKKKNKKTTSESFSFTQSETFQSILAVVFFVLAFFLAVAFFEKAGIVGEVAIKILKPLLGWGYFILPTILIILGSAFLFSVQRRMAWPQIIGGILFLLSGMGVLELIFTDKGGQIGALIAAPTLKLFDSIVAVVILLSLTIISLIIIFDTRLRLTAVWQFILKTRRLFGFGAKENSPNIGAVENEVENIKINDGSDEDLDEDMETKEAKESGEQIQKKEQAKKDTKNKNENLPINLSKISGVAYKAPPLDLLSRDSGKPGVGDIKANANIIKRTLQNFGINVEMDEITIGPTVTRYALKPAEGVKLSRIVGLQNDLALALAAHPLRIEAPIPGKSLVGIEIPNSIKTTVGLGSILAENEFQNSPKPMFIALGKAISGKAHFDDIARMPHLLIAGATGSGKSVMVHSLITSLLYRNSPENLKLILIDPKRVELTLYNKIPHLLTPVLTDPKKAILALKWAAKEMDRRYDILEAEKVRDIGSYHKNILEPVLKNKKGGNRDEAEMPEAMPYIVIFIDELADIMTSFPREMEAAVVRLAQMSRAVGIHLVLSTQRPSVNVITGLIKANIPTRIALQVASQIDSRTILDMTGAEKLLGAGDMLYLSSDMSKPLRIQTAYISEAEVKDVVKFIYENNPSDDSTVDINLETAQNAIELSNSDSDVDDDLYEEARELVVKAGKASTSYLQRRLRIGYARAARLIDMLEERGVVGAGEGAKPREVITNDEVGVENSPEEYGAENR